MLNFFPDRHRSARFRNRTLLVADWVNAGIVLSEVSLQESPPSVLRSHFEPWPSETGPLSEPEETGRWLKALCLSHDFPVESVVVSLHAGMSV